MDLQTYLQSHNLSRADIADMIGTSVGAVNHWISGRRQPRGDMLERIKSVTQGQVTANDFFHGGES